MGGIGMTVFVIEKNYCVRVLSLTLEYAKYLQSGLRCTHNIVFAIVVLVG